jgi:hypothetical protein
MKRLVNAYSVNRNISTLQHLDIEEGPLALWTILSLHWPLLADYLEKDPYSNKPSLRMRLLKIEALWRHIEVQQVIGGEETDTALEVKLVEQCSLLRS